MKKFKYVGPFDAIELPGVGVIQRGHTVQIDDPDLSDGLEQQPGNWEHRPVPKNAGAKKTAKPAAVTEPDQVPAPGAGVSDLTEETDR